MRDINVQATNQITVIGKLLESSIQEGTSPKTGKPYARANVTIRVEQSYDGNNEISEIEIPFFANKYTNSGKTNPAYETVQMIKEMKSAKSVGVDNADIIRIAGKSGGSVSENIFVNRNGTLVDTWQLRASFCSKGSKDSDTATWLADVFIMDMREEYDREEQPTGRLLVKGGIVQYGGKLDIINFIVEDPSKVDYFTRNYNVNDTVQVWGRIRMTSKEVTTVTKETNGWGEDLKDHSSTRKVRELIMTGGEPFAYDEDMAYDPTEIKKAFNVRKARVEQTQMDAANKQQQKKAVPVVQNTIRSDDNPYAWEE